MSANFGTYYVVLCSYGKRGHEAIVDPELTRRDIVARIANHDFAHDQVVAVHEIREDGFWSDVTDEIMAEARVLEAA